MTQLGYGDRPSDAVVSATDANDVLDSLQTCLKNEKLHPHLISYLMYSLNQEALFKADQFYSHYRASMLSRAISDSDLFFQQRLQFVRHIEVSDSNHLTLTMHAFIRSKNKLIHLAESKYTIVHKPSYQISVECTSHRFFDVDSLLYCAQSRLDTFLSLVKYSDHLNDSSLKHVVLLIDKLNQQASQIRKRVLAGDLHRGDEQKLKALGEVVNHAAHYAVRLAGGFHQSSLKDSRNLLKNTLIRNAKVLNKHRSHIWRLWNALCRWVNPWGKTRALIVESDSASASGFFKPAVTESFSLVKDCFVTCKA